VCFTVVDCPTEEYLDNLVMNSKWKKYQYNNLSKSSSSKDDEDSPTLIVHFTPERILLNPKYIKWMESFSPTTQHLLINDSCLSLGSEAVHRLQYKLNLVDKNIFPLMYSDCERKVVSSNPDDSDPSRYLRKRYDDDDDSDSDTQTEENIQMLNPTRTSESSLSLPAVLPAPFNKIKVPIRLSETGLTYRLRPHEGFDE